MRKKIAVVGLLCALLLLLGCPQNGVAQLTSVTPNVITVGSPSTQISLAGANFTSPATVFLNGMQSLATTYVSSQILTAIIPAANLKVAGTATVRASFQAPASPNQVVTQSLTITIGNVAPTLTGSTPLHTIAGAAAVTMSLTGTNFNSTSVVEWNATTPVATTLVSSTQLTATVPGTLLTTAGTAKITVNNPGGGTSAALNFIVVAPLAVTTTTLPSGSLGVAYTATLTATGGTAPLTWSLASGSLPVGLTLSSAGVISGTPTAAGTSTFTVQVVDSTGSLARMSFGKK